MKQLNEKRLQRQLIGRHKWEQNNFIGIQVYATGFGKSFFSTFKTEEVKGNISYLLSKHPVQTLIIVNSTIVKTQWLDNIIKFIAEYSHLIRIETIQKLVINTSDINLSQIKFVVADEIDAYTSELRRVFINKTIICTRIV